MSTHLLADYRCQEGPAPAASNGANQGQADSGARQPEALVLRLPQLDSFHETCSRDASNTAFGQRAAQSAHSREPGSSQIQLTRQLSAHLGLFTHPGCHPSNARLLEQMTCTPHKGSKPQQANVQQALRPSPPHCLLCPPLPPPSCNLVQGAVSYTHLTLPTTPYV